MQQTIDRLSRELGLPRDVVIKTYRAYWLFIRTTIEKLPLKQNLDEVAFSKLRPNFNIPNLGKLVCPYERYIGIKKKQKVIQDKYAKHKENQANG